MFKRFFYFVRYDNFFTFGLMALFMGASVTFAASPDLRDSIVNKTEVYRSVDNRFIIGVDLDTFNMSLKVTAVKEDDEFYYVDYSYNTIEVEDYAWKSVAKTGSMKVSKKEILGKDLGLYVADQLGQFVDQQLAYLKEVKDNEQKKGLTEKVLATEYSGLVGQFLNSDEKEFPGYTPIIEPQESTYDPNAPATASDVGSQVAGAAGSAVVTQEQVRALVQEAVRDLLSQNQSGQDTQDDQSTNPDQTATDDTTGSTTASTSGDTITSSGDTIGGTADDTAVSTGDTGSTTTDTSSDTTTPPTTDSESDTTDTPPAVDDTSSATTDTTTETTDTGQTDTGGTTDTSGSSDGDAPPADAGTSDTPAPPGDGGEVIQ